MLESLFETLVDLLEVKPPHAFDEAGWKGASDLDALSAKHIESWRAIAGIPLDAEPEAVPVAEPEPGAEPASESEGESERAKLSRGI